MLKNSQRLAWIQALQRIIRACHINEEGLDNNAASLREALDGIEQNMIHAIDSAAPAEDDGISPPPRMLLDLAKSSQILWIRFSWVSLIPKYVIHRAHLSSN